MKPGILVFFLILSHSLTVFGQETNYTLVWSDEFTGNGSIDAEKWHHQTQLPNGDSWYNGEIQHYTNRTINSEVSNGTLKIRAKKETFTDQGVTKEYTSARLNSKFAFTYGKMEVRAKLPSGRGTWPAIWTLGQNIIESGGFWSDAFGTVIWPACGELDIMEHWGSNQNFVQSATHTPSSFGDTVNKGGQVVSTASSEFHTYAMEWTEDKIIFSVDDVVHYIYEPSTQNSDTWPFTENQYILLNVAILPDIESAFTESSMEIDYVRVYQDELLSHQDRTNGVFLTNPNPVKDSLKIVVQPQLIGSQLKIYSVLGRTIQSIVIDDLQNEMDLTNLSSGTYFIQITKGDMRYIQQIVK